MLRYIDTLPACYSTFNLLVPTAMNDGIPVTGNGGGESLCLSMSYNR